MTIEELLIQHEGVRLKPYVCPAGKLTIGVGRNLEDVGISHEEALTMLRHDIWACIDDLSRFPWWPLLSTDRQYALIDMRFNLGPGRFRGFRKMLAALAGGDFEAAAREMRQSTWAEQVGRRAETLAQMMEQG